MKTLNTLITVSHWVTTIHEQISSGSGVSTKATPYTKTGTRTQTAKNSSNVTLYSFTVKGTYTVNPGVSATCTASSYSHTISNSDWYLDSASASRTGNKAMATGTFKRKILFIVVETQVLSPTLTCDKNGNLS